MTCDLKLSLLVELGVCFIVSLKKKVREFLTTNTTYWIHTAFHELSIPVIELHAQFLSLSSLCALFVWVLFIAIPSFFLLLSIQIETPFFPHQNGRTPSKIHIFYPYQILLEPFPKTRNLHVQPENSCINILKTSPIISLAFQTPICDTKP